jgi:predicted phage tail protein
MQQVVRLLGDLGERYGAEHTYYDLRTPADAIKLLCINSPKFQDELIHAHEHGVGYRLIQAGADLDVEDLHLPFGSKDLILVPVIAGSGGGVGKVIAGAVLVVAAIAVAVTFAPAGAGFLGFGNAAITASTAGAGATFAASASIALGSIGLSLVLGGVSQLLSPQPTIPKLGSNRLGSGEASSTDGPQGVTRGTDGRQSYAYTGAANSVGVGATIPVAYGEVLIGSHLISANVDVADESDPLKTAIKNPGKGTIRVGGEELRFGNFETASGVQVKRTRKNVRGSDNDFKAINKFIDLRNGETETEGNIDESTRRRDKLDFILELRDGLFDFVSGKGSTLVDAFFTYRIEVIVRRDGPDQVIATSQATVQGLLNNNDNYRWVHRVEHPNVDNDDEIKGRISIIDHRSDSKNTLFWQSYGYDLV